MNKKCKQNKEEKYVYTVQLERKSSCTRKYSSRSEIIACIVVLIFKTIRQLSMC